MIESHIIETGDIDQLAESLSGWSQEYDQIKPGRFSGKLTELWLGDVQICRETTKCGLIEKGSVRDGSYYAVLPLGSTGEGWINGETIGDNDAFCGSGGYEWCTKTADEWDLLLFVVPQDTVRERLQPEKNRQISRPAGHRIQNLGDVPHLKRLKYIARILFDFRDTEVPAEVADFFHTYLLENIISLFNQIEEDETAVADSMSKMMLTLQRARQLVEDHSYPLIKVEEIANELGISRRTFQKYCQTITGMPPSIFIRAIRLNNVRRRLKDSNSDERVLDAAFLNLFFHGGRFSKYYFQLFEEKPSATLRLDC